MSYQFGGSQLQTQSVPNAKYKTMLCRHYLATKQCAIGAKCQFAHGTQEQRQMNDPLPASALSAMASGIEQPVNKPQTSVFQIPCKYHAQNYCKNGSNCQYMHDPDSVQQQNTINQQQMQVISSPLPQTKPEDPMQIVFQHILIEMQQIFPQDEIIQKLKIAFDQTKIGNLINASECIKSIIHAPERTHEELLKYTNLYNQAIQYFNQISQVN
ncbi:unnamed protein product [Paramecium primaurelia]|uniref:C3H1-type domain-containing protein n=2 Tax=Paramecium TaxID=5884 RepID=A0A8S1S418_9CILI|nr:unnamed protein product [Paramecium primaurelia]CAD8134322.1 unnamed protein product [Paramecium pentaurelia]